MWISIPAFRLICGWDRFWTCRTSTHSRSNFIEKAIAFCTGGRGGEGEPAVHFQPLSAEVNGLRVFRLACWPLDRCRVLQWIERGRKTLFQGVFIRSCSGSRSKVRRVPWRATAAKSSPGSNDAVHFCGVFCAGRLVPGHSRGHRLMSVIDARHTLLARGFGRAAFGIRQE